MNLPSSIDVRSSTTLMLNQPSDLALSPTNPARAPPGFEKIGHVASHPDVQDDPTITTDVQLPQKLQQEAVSCSPVTRLPSETLAHIFELSIVPGELSVPFSIPAQVCRLWRAVAESNPHLWTSIRFYFPVAPRNREADVPRVTHVFDLYLMRSGTLPMSLTFADHRKYATCTTMLVSLLVDRLRTHSRRWKHISLRMTSDYFSLLFMFTPCDLSSLEHLYISGDATWRNSPCYLNLKSATNLKSFAYSGRGQSSNDKIDLDWEKLAELSFDFTRHGGELPQLLGYLPQCQNITTLSLGVHRGFEDGPRHNETIILPCLRTLRIRRFHPRSHVCVVIDPLVLPQLQILEIDAFISAGFADSSTPWHDHNFSNLLARSGCTLRHLSIRSVYFPSDELVRCLELSPALTSFRFIPSPRSQDIENVLYRLDVSQSRGAGPQPQEHGHADDLLAAGLRKLTLGPSIVPSPRPQDTGVVVRRLGTSGTTRGGREVFGDRPLVLELREITLGTSNERYLDMMVGMFRSRSGALASAAGVAALRRVEVEFFDPPRIAVSRLGVGRCEPPSERFRRELQQWISENENEMAEEVENEHSSMGRQRGDGRKLEASVVVHSPRVVECDGVARSVVRPRLGA